MTTRKTPLPTLLRRIALITVAVTMLAVPLTGCDDDVCSVCDESIAVDEHTVYDCDVHCEKYYSDDEGLHTTQCEHCDAYLCDGNDHGNGKCVEAPLENTCAVCTATLAEGEDHTAPCGNAAHCTEDTLTHDAAACGTAGHFTCDGKKHEKAACGVDGHLACDGKTHEKLACGHYGCDGKDHGAAPCKSTGHYACDGKDHTAKLFCGHNACADDAMLHRLATCGYPSHCSMDKLDHHTALCGIYGHCNSDGRSHGVGICTSGAVCPWCDNDVDSKAEHLAPCGEHYTCQSGYDAREHSGKRECGHGHCIRSEHWQCDHCGGWVCQSTNTHTQYPCGFGTHYSCNGYDVAATGSGTYEHKIFACEEHSDCIALTGLSYSNKAEDHYDCPECWYCVAVGHAPDCRSANQ